MANRIGVLKQKIDMYENSRVDAELDGMISVAIGNRQGIETSEKRLKEIMTALSFLKSVLDKWTAEDENPQQEDE